MSEEVAPSAPADRGGVGSWPLRADGSAGSAAVSHRKARRIALLEHCGTGNLGDDGTVAAVLQQIRRRWADASVVCLSLDPSDSQVRHGVPSFSIRQTVYPCRIEWTSDPREPATVAATLTQKLKNALRKNRYVFGFVKAIASALIVRPAQFIRELLFLASSFLVVLELDLLIVSGGGQLLDWGGPWAFPYTLFKWIALSKLAGTKCYFLNNGAGPLDHPVSRWFIKRAISLADYISVRDAKSGAFLRKIGFGGRVPVVADCAWSLNVAEHSNRRSARHPGEALVVGIAPMAYCDPTRHWVRDEASYQEFIRRMAEFCMRLIERGHRLSLFSSDIWFDSKAIADLETLIRNRFSPGQPIGVTCEAVTNIDELFARLSQVDCYVTCRFHGVIFSHLLTVPTLAISPHPKVRTLMEEAGLSEYCVDIAGCDPEDLMARFDRLVSDMEDVKARIRRAVANYQDALATQYDELFPTAR